VGQGGASPRCGPRKEKAALEGGSSNLHQRKNVQLNFDLSHGNAQGPFYLRVVAMLLPGRVRVQSAVVAKPTLPTVAPGQPGDAADIARVNPLLSSACRCGMRNRGAGTGTLMCPCCAAWSKQHQTVSDRRARWEDRP